MAKRTGNKSSAVQVFKALVTEEEEGAIIAAARAELEAVFANPALLKALVQAAIHDILRDITFEVIAEAGSGGGGESEAAGE